MAPVLEPEIEPAEQVQGVAVIRRTLFEPPESGQCLLVLLTVKLQFSLCQQDCVGGLGRLFVSLLEPVVPALVISQQVCRPGSLKVVEQRRITDVRGAGQKLFPLGKIALRNFDHAFGQSLAGTSHPVAARRLADFPGRTKQFYEKPGSDNDKEDKRQQDRHGHIYQVVLEVDDHVARIPQQEMRGKCADHQRHYNK